MWGQVYGDRETEEVNHIDVIIVGGEIEEQLVDMAKKSTKKEETLNLDNILFMCRDILRQAKNSGSFFEKRDMMLAHGVVQKAHEVHAAEEDHKTHLKRRGAPQGGVDAVEREQSHDALNDLMRHARPYAGVRLTVIFFHDLVDLGGGYGLVAVIVRGRPGGGLYLLCRSIGALFLEQGHMKTILSSRYFAEPGSAELSKVSGCFLAQ